MCHHDSHPSIKKDLCFAIKAFKVVSSQKLGPSKTSQYRRSKTLEALLLLFTWSCCSTANSRCPGRTSVTGSRGDCLPQAGTSCGRARVWRDLGQSVQWLLSPPLDGSGVGCYQFSTRTPTQSEVARRASTARSVRLPTWSSTLSPGVSSSCNTTLVNTEQETTVGDSDFSIVY